MRLAPIQMNSRSAARDENVERASAFVSEAASLHPDMVILPEFFNGVFLAACNHVGKEGEWAMSGRSMVIDPLGKILTQASGTEEQVLSADIDQETVIRARQRFLLARDRRPDAYTAITRPTEELHR